MNHGSKQLLFDKFILDAWIEKYVDTIPFTDLR